MSDEKRSYKKQKRAELEEQTHLRITESAVQLHGTLGPLKTTISAIAEHAGVRRSTVYRHFPDDEALYTACSSHWLGHNPFPDPASWLSIEDIEERRMTAFFELYGYYRRNTDMLRNILRDEKEIPALQKVLAGYHGYLGQVKGLLTEGARQSNASLASAAIGHALAFSSWSSMALEEGLDDHQCATLMCALASSADGRR